MIEGLKSVKMDESQTFAYVFADNSLKETFIDNFPSLLGTT